jgi:hypothetical protein
MPTPWTADRIASQAGKTALITGANSGIGFQAALESLATAHMFSWARVTPSRGKPPWIAS